MAMQDVRVSLIVRSMDRPTLAAAVDSIRGQAYRPIEVVVVNASGRRHSALPADGDGLSWRLVGTEGVALRRPAAANAGLLAASGALLTFLDDDDLLLPGHLDKLVHALACEPQAPAAYTDVDYGEYSGQDWTSRHCFAAPFDRYRLLFENYLPIHAVMFRRTDDCRFDEQFDLFEDWDFWLQLAQRADFVRVPGISARYVAQAQENSGVFVASEAAGQARRQLLAKWYRRLGEEAYGGLIDYLQALYRSQDPAALAATRAELARTQAEAARMADGLNAIIQARDAEIRERAAGMEDLRRLVAAREQEVANGEELAAGLRHILAARETELANTRQTLQSLQALHDAEGPLAAFGRALKRKMNEHR